MSGAAELATLDAIGQAELVRRGDVTPRELVDAAIERIEALDPAINAVITRFDERARTEAEVPPPLPGSPLAGVPFLLKDLGSPLAGVRQAGGSRALLDNVPAADGELVRRYKRAGLLIVGKTNTPEFGNHSTTEPVAFGPTRNPWALDRTAGGSSGGSAAAVAAGMVPAAHGGDGAGSIRIPASCCGLVGLKPTRGRVPRAPNHELGASLAVEHVLTRTVRDTAAFLDATAGRTAGDAFVAPSTRGPFLAEVGAEPGRLRIGWSAVPPIDATVDPVCVDAARSTAELLASLGHEVEEAAPSFDGKVLLEAMGLVWAASNTAGAATIEARIGRQLRPDELEITTRELVEVGRQMTALDLLRAYDDLAQASRDIAPFFERYDAWLTPTLAQPPLPLGVLNASYGGGLTWWRFDLTFNPRNPIANAAGLPSISLPLAWSADGLPIGSLLTGRFGDEVTLLRLAGQLEKARPWADRRPPAVAG